MVKTEDGSQGSPEAWGSIKLIVIGDSYMGNISLKSVPIGERPKLRSRPLKDIQLHQLLPKVETEISKYNPSLLVVFLGLRDLTHSGCRHFPKADHQHRVRTISHDFKIKLAAEEIFQHWHEWLAKFSCKVLIALPYPINFQEYNSKKLQHCSDCDGCYTEDGETKILEEKIKELGELLAEQNVPVMYTGDVLKKINPNYMEKDLELDESERALDDGIKVSKKFSEVFFSEIKEVALKTWPDFLGKIENYDETEKAAKTGKAAETEKAAKTGKAAEPEKAAKTGKAAETSAIKTELQEPKPDSNGEAAVLPPKKKSKFSFRF